MALSYIRVPGDGVTTAFGFAFDYLATAHITVKVDGVPTAFTWVNAYQINVSPAPAAGLVVEVRRTTPGAALLVTFTDGSVLVSSNLNLANTQALFVTQEALDEALDRLGKDATGHYDVGGRRLKNLGDATSPDDAITYGQFSTAVNSTAAAATAAAISADSSAASAVSSSNSMVAAAASAVAALAYSQDALAYRNTASTHATTATTKASEAASSATTAGSHKDAAAASATTASTHKDAAAASATTAGGHAGAATTKASEAAASATTAGAHATTASTHKDAAATSAVEAAASAVAAALFDPSSYYTKTVTDTLLANKAATSHTHTIANVTGLQTALDAKAALASPALTGNPTAPTQAAASNNTRLATTAFVAAAIAPVHTNAASLGYLGAPQNNQDVAYTLVAADAGKVIRQGGATARAWTIPPNSGVAFAIGTIINMRNVGTGIVTITPGAGVTLRQAGTSNTGARTLAQHGEVSLRKDDTDTWYVSGAGLA
ncbi:MAG: phage tail fiber protein [Parvibaculum sp.]|uniref:phage tail fiber domain-containing protein n=1 Tax=Parvibaculum sp. TaxID=2024848 RepID=UPI0027175C5B|nr:phage tail fiber protein [Parvibaculum sp.]MDO8839647.1 phage tail fiber protein [Parvibaculum sp.]